MIEQILQNIPEDAPELLTNFILEKEQELGGKLYVQLAYKNILVQGKTQKNVVVTIFCKQPDKAFPLPDFNNKPIKIILEEYKKHLSGQWKMLLAFFDVQKMLNKAFSKLEEKNKGIVRILIYNQEQDEKTETIFEIKSPEKEEKHTFSSFLKSLLASNPDDLMQMIQ